MIFSFHIPLLGNVLNSLFIFFLFSVLFSHETKDKKETSKMKLSPFYVAQEHAVLSELHRCLERVYEAANALRGQIERNYFFPFYFFLFLFFFFFFFSECASRCKHLLFDLIAGNHVSSLGVQPTKIEFVNFNEE